MSPLMIIGLLAVLLIAYVLLKPYWIAHKRQKIRQRPFEKSWREILKRNVPYFYRMPADLQLQLKQHIQVFLAEKQFVGFKGIEITDEIRVTIAAQACLLILNRPTDYYSKLRYIYVYPVAFITHHSGHDGAGVLQNQKRVLSGESWNHGKVVLSWRDSKEGAKDFNDGRNVVIHEFAHQLDQETGSANGAPYLPNNSQHNWSSILTKAFQELQQRAVRGEPSLLDYYGATNPAEFFAVASEVFFEQPTQLQRDSIELYQQLSQYYQVNPAIW
ncbi:zinc-dependent peptidase [Aliikangiella maris]|uniref:M90 family metallopeptidase n=2 Tax=Aliikangiella maris TaxID=3162458 RepID=A0ABV3MJW2_9GAMM